MSKLPVFLRWAESSEVTVKHRTQTYQYIVLTSAAVLKFMTTKLLITLLQGKGLWAAWQRCSSVSHTSGTSGFWDLIWVMSFYFVFRIISTFPTRKHGTKNSDLSFTLWTFMFPPPPLFYVVILHYNSYFRLFYTVLMWNIKKRGFLKSLIPSGKTIAHYSF